MSAVVELSDFSEPLPPPARRFGGSHTGPPAVAVLPGGTAGYKRDRIAVSFAYSEDLMHRLAQALGGGRTWHADLRVWSVPLTTSNCLKLREVFGPTMQRSPELISWYQEKARQENAEALERARRVAARERERQAAIDLAAERALYGSTSGSPLQPGGGVPGALGEADLVIVGDPPPRVPLAECAPTSMLHIAPPDPRYADDWRVPLQSEGAAWLSTNRGGVLADEVGLGKTRTCVMAALDGPRALVGVHLVVAPLKPARGTWPEEIRKWAPTAAIIEWPLGSASDHVRKLRRAAVQAAEAAGKRGTRRPVFLVVNHDAVRLNPGLADVTWASVIVDEAHEVLSIGNRGATSTKNAAGLRRLAVHAEEGMRVACTGTPFAGRLGNLWGLLDFVAPDRHGDRKTFVGAYTAPAGEVGSGVTLDRVQPGREAAWGGLMADWVLRRTRTAAQRAMIEHRIEVVDPLPEQLEQDKQWRDRTTWSGPHAETADARPVPVGDRSLMVGPDGVMPDVIVAVTRRIQLAVGAMDGIDDDSMLAGAKATYSGPSAKVDRLEQMLGDWGLLHPEWWHLAGEHGKVIVASPWTSGLDLVQAMLARHLPASSWCRIDGATSPAKVDAARQAFSGARGPGILLLSSTAGGAGLTLDQHCTRLVILSEHWTSDVQAQVVGRIANRTWETHREVTTLRTGGMLDTYIGRRAEHQDHVQTSMLELASARP